MLKRGSTFVVMAIFPVHCTNASMDIVVKRGAVMVSAVTDAREDSVSVVATGKLVNVAAPVIVTRDGRFTDVITIPPIVNALPVKLSAGIEKTGNEVN